MKREQRVRWLGLVAASLAAPLCAQNAWVYPQGQFTPPLAGYTQLDAADFNGDGRRDVVIVTSGSPRFLLRLSTPDGGYGVAYDFDVAGYPGASSTAVGDFDADGYEDLAALVVPPNGSSSGNALALVFGASSSSLGPLVLWSPTPLFWTLEAADIDGDGDADLVGATGYPSGQGFAVLASNGDRTFAAPVLYGASAPYRVLAVADLDGDAQLDVLTFSYSLGLLRAYLGDGTGVFAPPLDSPAPAYSYSGQPAVGDFDGDGTLDVAGLTPAGSLSEALAVQLGSGDGSFQAPTHAAESSSFAGLTAADWNDDGRPELATTDTSMNVERLRVWAMDASGTLVEQPPYRVGELLSVLATDLDGDLLPDLVGSGLDTEGVVVLINGGGDVPLQYAETLPVALGPSAIADADLDADGDVDLVVTGGGSGGGLAIVANDGLGNFDVLQHVPIAISLLSASLGDVDGDGTLDVVVGSMDRVAWLRGLGAGHVGGLTTIGQVAGPATVGDFDLDGDLDVAALDRVAFELRLWSNDGSAHWAAPSTYALNATANLVIRACDVDVDGDLDLVCGGADPGLSHTGVVVVALNDGAGAFDPELVFVGTTNSLDLDLGDLDADGDPDLVIFRDAPSPVSVLKNLGGAWSAPTSFAHFASAKHGRLGDVDLDGDLDVVEVGQRHAVVFRGQGDGTLATPDTHALDYGGFRPVALADVDGDQDLDLVTGSESWLRLELLRNQRWRAPVTYCFANADSHGCAATVAASGSASASSSAPFTLSASDVLSNKFGLLFYGHAPKSAAFHGSVLCAAPPLVRTPAQGSGGNAPPVEDCSGSFALDFNARIQAGVDPSLVAGATVTAQYWYRDPSAPSTTALSSAVRFWIRP